MILSPRLLFWAQIYYTDSGAKLPNNGLRDSHAVPNCNAESAKLDYWYGGLSLLVVCFSTGRFYAQGRALKPIPIVCLYNQFFQL